MVFVFQSQICLLFFCLKLQKETVFFFQEKRFSGKLVYLKAILSLIRVKTTFFRNIQQVKWVFGSQAQNIF